MITKQSNYSAWSRTGWGRVRRTWERKTDNRKISQRRKKGRNMERDVGKGGSGDGQRAGKVYFPQNGYFADQTVNFAGALHRIG